MTSKEEYKIGSDGLRYRVVPLHTKEKHNLFKKFLDIVSNAMQNKWPLVYVDLYSSNGKCVIRDTNEEINGSPLIALEYSYQKYIFNDLEKDKIDELRQRIKKQFPDKESRCYFYSVDANSLFQELQKDRIIPDRHLITVFSDPNDLAPDYSTIKYISDNFRADILFHFSYGMDLKRNLLTYENSELSKLDGFIGDLGWRALSELNEPKVTKYYFKKLLELGYIGFSDNPDSRSVKNSKGSILYYFLLLSKHPLAKKFYKAAMKYSSIQTDLFN